MHHPSCQQKQNSSGRVLKTLCLQVERAAPVTRTVSSTCNCDTGTYQSSKYRPSACKRSPRGPCIFVSCARSLQQKQNPSESLQVSSCQPEQNPSGFVRRTLCLQVGGGCAPLPTPPPLFFLNREGLLSRTSHHQQEPEHRTMNKNDVKHIVLIELIKTHDAGILLANGGGGCVHSKPAFFLRRTRPLQVSSCRGLDVVFESVGVCLPPPPLSY